MPPNEKLLVCFTPDAAAWCVLTQTWWKRVENSPEIASLLNGRPVTRSAFLETVQSKRGNWTDDEKGYLNLLVTTVVPWHTLYPPVEEEEYSEWANLDMKVVGSGLGAESPQVIVIALHESYSPPPKALSIYVNDVIDSGEDGLVRTDCLYLRGGPKYLAMCRNEGRECRANCPAKPLGASSGDHYNAYSGKISLPRRVEEKVRRGHPILRPAEVLVALRQLSSSVDELWQMAPDSPFRDANAKEAMAWMRNP